MPFVGNNVRSGETFMFCNGIMNSFDDAKSGAQIVANAFGNRKVFIYHNPTSLSNYFDVSIEKYECQAGLANALAEKIMEFILADQKEKIEQSCVTLFVHSHGAVIAEAALKSLSGVKDKLKVYAFGGATVIPNQLADKVDNYIFNEDLVSIFANLDPSKKNVLSSVKQIAEIADKKNISLEEAILEQAYRDLFLDLNPLNRTVYSDDKVNRFKQIFVENNKKFLMSDQDFLKKIDEYCDYFKDHNIFILKGTPFIQPNYNEIKTHSNIEEFGQNILGNIFGMVGNFVKGLGAAGLHALENHQFSAYESVVKTIASQEKS